MTQFAGNVIHVLCRKDFLQMEIARIVQNTKLKNRQIIKIVLTNSVQSERLFLQAVIVKPAQTIRSLKLGLPESAWEDLVRLLRS